jgi:hypothetical protein
MKSFYSSNYDTIFDCVHAKAQYYEKLCKQLVDQLVSDRVLVYDKEPDEYYWEATGDRLGDDL